MQGFSLTQAIRRAVAIRPDQVAVIDAAARLTWRQFADRVARLAAAFSELGVQPGDRIVLLALNSHRTLECFYAAMWAGAVIVPLNHRLGLGEIVAQTNDRPWWDPPITTNGTAQAWQCGQHLLSEHRAKPFARIHVSPCTRTLQSASHIATSLALPLKPVPGLAQCAAAIERHGLASYDPARPPPPKPTSKPAAGGGGADPHRSRDAHRFLDAAQYAR